MIVLAERSDLARAREALTGTVAVVMTMGALHEGHAELIRAAVRSADTVLVTIFVNPLQFGAGEDLDRYPRTLEADLALCESDPLTASEPQLRNMTVAATTLGGRLTHVS